MSCELAHDRNFGKVAQIVVDLHECEASLSDGGMLETLLHRSAAVVGATVVGQARCEYVPHGITLVLFLAESHLLISTWPEYRLAVAEVMLCNEKMEPDRVATILKEALRPGVVTTHRILHDLRPQADGTAKLGAGQLDAADPVLE